MHTVPVAAVVMLLLSGCMATYRNSNLAAEDASPSRKQVGPIAPHEVASLNNSLEIQRWVGTVTKSSEKLLIVVVPNFLTVTIERGIQNIDPAFIGSGKNVIVSGSWLGNGIQVDTVQEVPARNYTFPLFGCSSVSKSIDGSGVSYFIEADEHEYEDGRSQGEIKLLTYKHPVDVKGDARFSQAYLINTFQSHLTMRVMLGLTI